MKMRKCPSGLLPLLALLIAPPSAAAASAVSSAPVAIAGYQPATVQRLAAEGWRTDLSRLEVPLDAIRTCGLPRSAFTAIRTPAHAPAGEVELDPAEPVLVVRGDDRPTAWPLVHLLRRELALDEVDGIPVAVTFCSVCGTARVWDRRLEKGGGAHAGGAAPALDLAVSGLLLDGNSLLFDRETESLWRQVDGRAVAGDLAGRSLREVPSFVISFGALRRARPDAWVLLPPAPAPDPPFRILAGREVASGTPPEWLDVSCPRPLEPSLAVADGDVIPAAGPAVENLGAYVVLRDPDARTPYRDSDGGASPPAGSAVAFRRELDGRELTFEARDGAVFDAETDTRWNLLGEAVEGPLAGRTLAPARQLAGFRFAVITAGR